MDLRDYFETNLRLWKRHCYEMRFRSDPAAFEDCDAYRRIVAMGPRALPLIRDYYGEAIAPMGWASAIGEIAGRHPDIPDEDLGIESKVRTHYKTFLDELLQQL